MPTKIAIAQVEYPRADDGKTQGFQPDYSQLPAGMFSCVTPLAVTVVPAFSSHATAVAKLLIGGYASGLISSVKVLDSFTSLGRAEIPDNPYGCNGGRTTTPAKIDWLIENGSWGGSSIVFQSMLSQKALQLQQNNAIGVYPLPDGGMQPYPIYGWIKSDHVLLVGSSVSAYVSTINMQPDVLLPVTYTSYCAPTLCQTLAAMISWCLDNKIAYQATDIVSIVKQVAKRNNLNHDHNACMNMVQNFYATPSIMPSGTANPAISPTPTPPSTPPVATAPAPTPVVATPPTLSIDTICANAAAAIGISYSSSTQAFSNLTFSKVGALYKYLVTQKAIPSAGV